MAIAKRSGRCVKVPESRECFVDRLRDCIKKMNGRSQCADDAFPAIGPCGGEVQHGVASSMSFAALLCFIDARRPVRGLLAVCAETDVGRTRGGRAWRGSPAYPVADFVTIWAGYDTGNRPVRHYDGPRRRQALAGFAAAARAARLIHRLIWNIDHEL
ncbi:hypothetical protein [Burkholderia latens]|uniref:hypothetical protein n=1 Tax=Burkholderia latens TaxID=488446 RepID=UPI00158D7532|nr:hypothetical protein [Burkholderia latens]